jgi:hypothetical protein
VLSRHPAALQLRYLQTATEIAAENNSTTLFPIPLDIFRPFMERLAGGGAAAAAPASVTGTAAPTAGTADAAAAVAPDAVYLPGTPLPGGQGAAAEGMPHPTEARRG